VLRKTRERPEKIPRAGAAQEKRRPQRTGLGRVQTFAAFRRGVPFRARSRYLGRAEREAGV